MREKLCIYKNTYLGHKWYNKHKHWLPLEVRLSSIIEENCQEKEVFLRKTRAFQNIYFFGRLCPKSTDVRPPNHLFFYDRFYVILQNFRPAGNSVPSYLECVGRYEIKTWKFLSSGVTFFSSWDGGARILTSPTLGNLMRPVLKFNCCVIFLFFL
jgi:hypothetical protein